MRLCLSGTPRGPSKSLLSAGEPVCPEPWLCVCVRLCTLLLPCCGSPQSRRGSPAPAPESALAPTTAASLLGRGLRNRTRQQTRLLLQAVLPSGACHLRARGRVYHWLTCVHVCLSACAAVCVHAESQPRCVATSALIHHRTTVVASCAAHLPPATPWLGTAAAADARHALDAQCHVSRVSLVQRRAGLGV